MVCFLRRENTPLFSRVGWGWWEEKSCKVVSAALSRVRIK